MLYLFIKIQFDGTTNNVDLLSDRKKNMKHTHIYTDKLLQGSKTSLHTNYSGYWHTNTVSCLGSWVKHCRTRLVLGLVNISVYSFHSLLDKILNEIAWYFSWGNSMNFSLGQYSSIFFSILYLQKTLSDCFDIWMQLKLVYQSLTSLSVSCIKANSQKNLALKI